MTFLSTNQALRLNALTVEECRSLPLGLAGQMVGSMPAGVLVAGGSFWTAPAADGGRKEFDDRVYVRTPGSGSWELAVRLPNRCAYGAAVSLPNTMVLMGGQNTDGELDSVWAVVGGGGGYRVEAWPSLPAPVSGCCAALCANRIYLFGGQLRRDPEASQRLWSLRLDEDFSPLGGWQQEPVLPGAGRLLAAAAGDSERIFVLGGAALEGREGTQTRRYLDEAWTYQPLEGWTRLPDLPTPVVAASAVCYGAMVVLISGDDGRMVGVVRTPEQPHPGFRQNILGFDRQHGQWEEIGMLPLGLVTTGCAMGSNGRIVVPGGEDRPGSRSNRVFELCIYAAR